MDERRAFCESHREKTDELRDTVFGNGRIGIKDRVIKLEVMIWIVIVLLIGNGSLLAYTLKTLSK